jgi:hypothetical protein
LSTTFANRVVEGTIRQGVTPRNQAPESDFTEALDAVFNSGLVESVRWRQYTPYFNDGDVCEFGAHGVYFELSEAGLLAARLTGQNDRYSDYDDGFINSYSLKELPTYGILREFESAVESGRHFVLMTEKFGDHAVVTATKEKFVVDSYDHE